jgi:hypothetical protein
MDDNILDGTTNAPMSSLAAGIAGRAAAAAAAAAIREAKQQKRAGREQRHAQRVFAPVITPDDMTTQPIGSVAGVAAAQRTKKQSKSTPTSTSTTSNTNAASTATAATVTTTTTRRTRDNSGHSSNSDVKEQKNAIVVVTPPTPAVVTSTTTTTRRPPTGESKSPISIVTPLPFDNTSAIVSGSTADTLGYDDDTYVDESPRDSYEFTDSDIGNGIGLDGAVIPIVGGGSGTGNSRGPLSEIQSRMIEIDARLRQLREEEADAPSNVVGHFYTSSSLLNY